MIQRNWSPPISNLSAPAPWSSALTRTKSGRGSKNSGAGPNTFLAVPTIGRPTMWFANATYPVPRPSGIRLLNTTTPCFVRTS